MKRKLNQAKKTKISDEIGIKAKKKMHRNYKNFTKRPFIFNEKTRKRYESIEQWKSKQSIQFFYTWWYIFYELNEIAKINEE